MMRCERCDQGERVAVLRAKMAERSGRVAVVLGVPMEECPACAERYLSWEVAEKLDALLDAMLSGDVEIATRHFEVTSAA
jgi:YgiT-type zinc finger domain-containing protein